MEKNQRNQRFENDFNRFYEDVKIIVPHLFKEEKENTKDKIHFFVKEWYPHMHSVSIADDSYFKQDEIKPFIFPGILFSGLMSELSEPNKQKIWEYLHNLFALSLSVPEVKECYGEEYPDEKIKCTIDSYPELIGNMVDWKRSKQNQDKNNQDKNNQDKNNQDKNNQDKNNQDKNNFLENSSIFKLAQDISSEINPEELKDFMTENQNPEDFFKKLLSGEKNSNITQLMEKVVGKLKNKIDSGEINQEELLKDASSLMQNFNLFGGNAENKGGPGLFDILGLFGGNNENKSSPGFYDIMNLAKKMNLFGESPLKSKKRKNKSKSQIKKKINKSLKKETKKIKTKK
jgi:hypothetical protein